MHITPFQRGWRLAVAGLLALLLAACGDSPQEGSGPNGGPTGGPGPGSDPRLSSTDRAATALVRPATARLVTDDPAKPAGYVVAESELRLVDGEGRGLPLARADVVSMDGINTRDSDVIVRWELASVDTVAATGGVQPVHAVLLIDQSSSMASTDPTGQRAVAARALVDRAGSDDWLEVHEFFPWRVVLGPTRATSAGRTSLRSAITARPSSPAALHDAIESSCRRFAINTDVKLRPRWLVVATDGPDNASVGYNAVSAALACAAVGVRIAAIGLDVGNSLGDGGRASVHNLAAYSGGVSAVVSDAAQLLPAFIAVGDAMAHRGSVSRVRWTGVPVQPGSGAARLLPSADRMVLAEDGRYTLDLTVLSPRGRVGLEQTLGVTDAHLRPVRVDPTATLDVRRSWNTRGDVSDGTPQPGPSYVAWCEGTVGLAPSNCLIREFRLFAAWGAYPVLDNPSAAVERMTVGIDVPLPLQSTYAAAMADSSCGIRLVLEPVMPQPSPQTAQLPVRYASGRLEASVLLPARARMLVRDVFVITVGTITDQLAGLKCPLIDAPPHLAVIRDNRSATHAVRGSGPVGVTFQTAMPSGVAAATSALAGQLNADAFARTLRAGDRHMLRKVLPAWVCNGASTADAGPWLSITPMRSDGALGSLLLDESRSLSLQSASVCPSSAPSITVQLTPPSGAER